MRCPVGSLHLKLAKSLVHGIALTHFVPLILAFSYVNTVLFVNLAYAQQLSDALDGRKDSFYACTIIGFRV